MKRKILALVAYLACCAPAALAQDYPARAIRIVIPLTAGSGADIAGRIVAKHLSDTWKMLHIPYKGSPEAIQDTIAGRTSFYMAPINTAIGLLKEGRLGALGVSTRGRSDVLPEVPPLAEQGLSGFDISLWFGMWARAGTPPAVVQRLNAQINAIVQGAEVREQFGKLGIAPSPMKPDEFGKFVRGQIATYRSIVKDAGIPPQ